MGRSMASVPFYTEDIKIGEVVAGSDIDCFSLDGKSIKDFTRGKAASLFQYDDGSYLLKMRLGGRWVEFKPEGI